MGPKSREQDWPHSGSPLSICGMTECVNCQSDLRCRRTLLSKCLQGEETERKGEMETREELKVTEGVGAAASLETNTVRK